MSANCKCGAGPFHTGDEYRAHRAEAHAKPDIELLAGRLDELDGTSRMGLLDMLLYEHRATCDMDRDKCPTEKAIPAARATAREAAAVLRSLGDRP